VLFNIFVSNTNSGIESILSKFANDPKPSGAADLREGKGCHPEGPRQA